MKSSKVKLYVYDLMQDDPKKCTAAKLHRFNLVRRLIRASEIPRKSFLLNPFSQDVLTPLDRFLLAEYGVVAVDGSWRRIDDIFKRKFRGKHRRLPLLLAVNPVNYGQIGKLSSLEALVAALFITGFKEQAYELVKIFNWAQNFLEINRRPLESYSQANGVEEILNLESLYFKGK